MKKFCLGTIVLVIAAGAIWWLAHGNPPPATPATTKDTAAAPADAAPEPGKVHLETDEQETAGITTAQPKPMEYKPEAKGFARVLDPAPMVALLADIDTDTTALAASSKEYERQKTLMASNNTSERALEMAQAAMQHDQTQLAAAQAHLMSDWGKALATRADLSDLVKTLVSQDAALLRVDMLGGETLPAEPRELRLAPLMGDAAPVPAELLGPAPSTDVQGQGASFLALDTQNPPPPGTEFVALMAGSGEGEKGFYLPSTAIIRYDSDTFVYVQTNGEDFERWRVKLGPPLRDGGAFVLSGVSAQDNVVITGAQQLLSEELSAATGGPD